MSCNIDVPPLPDLSVLAELHFGAIETFQEFTAYIPVTNNTNEPIEVGVEITNVTQPAKFSLDSGTETMTIVIPPGGTVEFPIHIFPKDPEFCHAWVIFTYDGGSSEVVSIVVGEAED